MNTFTAPCIHLSTYYRELKSLPIDQVTVIPSNPYEIDTCEWMELIGKNLDEIISNITISDDVNHYNRLRCEQYGFNSYSPILVYWKFQGRVFVFEFWLRYVIKYNSHSLFSVDYEIENMWEIVGTTKNLLNMTGIDEMTAQELTKYMHDFKEDFILLKSAV